MSQRRNYVRFSRLPHAAARSALAVLAMLCVAAPVIGQSTGSGWQIETTPYLWASGIKGTVGVGERTAEINVTFSEMLENLEGAFVLPMEARNGRWGIGFEMIRISVGDESSTPGSLFSSADFKAKQSIIELGPRYRVVSSPPFALDVLVGARWWRMDNELDLEAGTSPAVELELDENWVDPLGGVRMFVDLSSRLLLHARADVGGFGVGSQLSWQALGGLAYQFSESFTLRAGYRQLDVDFDDGDNGFIYDVGTGGLVLGATFRF